MGRRIPKIAYSTLLAPPHRCGEFLPPHQFIIGLVALLTTDNSLSRKFINSLVVVTEEIRKLGIKWVIVGSASLALQGVQVRPQDIDILTTRGGADAINAQLKEYETKEVRCRRSALFQSHLGDFEVHGVKVQVMGQLKVKIRSRWVSLMPRLRNPRMLHLQGHIFPVTPVRRQLETYKALARRKSKSKVKKIKEFLATRAWH